MTFVRDFSVTNNRGLYVRACGDFSYKAVGFDGKKLKKFEIDWMDQKGYSISDKKAKADLKKGKCINARFRGFNKITFILNKAAKMIQICDDTWIATPMLQKTA